MNIFHNTHFDKSNIMESFQYIIIFLYGRSKIGYICHKEKHIHQIDTLPFVFWNECKYKYIIIHKFYISYIDCVIKWWFSLPCSIKRSNGTEKGKTWHKRVQTAKKRYIVPIRFYIHIIYFCIKRIQFRMKLITETTLNYNDTNYRK